MHWSSQSAVSGCLGTPNYLAKNQATIIAREARCTESVVWRERCLVNSVMRPAVAIAILACCLVLDAEAADPTCKDWTCQASHLVVPKTKDDLTLVEANNPIWREANDPPVTADECRKTPEYVNATDGTIFWEDCACDCSGPVRVALVALLAVVGFYSVVVFLFVSGIKILRSGPAKEYEDLKAAGKVREDTEEIGGDSATAWMTKSEDEIRTDVR